MASVRDADTGAADGVVSRTARRSPRAPCSPTPTRCAPRRWQASRPLQAGARPARWSRSWCSWTPCPTSGPGRGPNPGRGRSTSASRSTTSPPPRTRRGGRPLPRGSGGVPDGGRSHAHELDPPHPARPVAVLPVLPAGRRRGRGGGRRDVLRRGLPRLPDRIVNTASRWDRAVEARFEAYRWPHLPRRAAARPDARTALQAALVPRRGGPLPGRLRGASGRGRDGRHARLPGGPGRPRRPGIACPDGLARRHRRADPAASTPPARSNASCPARARGSASSSTTSTSCWAIRPSSWGRSWTPT